MNWDIASYAPATIAREVREYLNDRETVDAMGRKRRWPSLATRISQKVAQPNDRGCIEWLGYRNANGYGQVGVWGRKLALVHRVTLEISSGRLIPEGLYACHRCDNPPCCNPAHLYMGNAKQNSADAWDRGLIAPIVGHRNGMTKLSDDAVREIIRLVSSGQSCTTVARYFGVHESHVSRISRRLRRSAVGG